MIGLDIAKSCGVAYNVGDKIYTFIIAGDPFVQSLAINEAMILANSKKIVAEDLPRLRNMKTTKSLLRRQGQLEAFLSLAGAEIVYERVSEIRRWIGASKKETIQIELSKSAGFELMSDEADAIATLLHGLKKTPRSFSYERVIIRDWPILKRGDKLEKFKHFVLTKR